MSNKIINSEGLNKALELTKEYIDSKTSGNDELEERVTELESKHTWKYLGGTKVPLNVIVGEGIEKIELSW